MGEKELSEIEILKDKHVTEAINSSLLRDSIDLKSKQTYWKQEKYRKYRTKYIEKEGYQFISYDFYIEKIILGQVAINQIKNEKFAVGTQKQIYSGDITERALYNEILDEYDNRSSLKGVENKFKDAVNKGGILKQFIEIFGFSILDYECDDIFKYKLMELLFLYTKTDILGEKTNVLKLFQKPSFENVDKTYFNEKNCNGEHIAILKNELMKEIQLEDIRKYNYSLVEAMNNWEKLLSVSVKYMLNRDIYDLKRLALFLEKNVVEQLYSPNVIIEQKPKMRLFDTVYFKVLQHEKISIRKDFLRISKDTIKKLSCITIEKLSNDYLVKPNMLKSFVKTHKEELAVHLYPDFGDNETAIEFVAKNAKNTELLWEYFVYSYETEEHSKIPYEFIVAMLIALKEASLNEEIFNYSYYRAKESGDIIILKRLNRKSSTEEVFYRLWAKKIYFIYICILGKREEAKYCVRIEDALDKISLFLLQYHNVDDFELCNEYELEIIQRSFVKDELALKRIRFVADCIAERTGYKSLLMHPNVNKLFKMVGPDFDYNQIIDGFVEVINTANIEGIRGYIKLPIQIIMEPSKRIKECFFMCKVHPETKEIEWGQFCEIESNRISQKLRKLGFVNLIVDSNEDVARVWPD